MFTETELRDALEHSASRADELHDQDQAWPTGLATGWRRFATPLLTAAMVAGTIVGIVVATAPERSADQAAAPRATTPAALLDLLHVGNPDGFVGIGVDYEFGYHSVSAVAELVPSGGTRVDLIPHGEPYDADAIPRDHPVRIDGRTGYYGHIPFNPHASRGESTPKVWAVAFRNGRGDWVFASLNHSSPAQGDYADPGRRTTHDPDAIVTAYEALDVSFAPLRNRVAYRLGWLPRGASVVGVEEPVYGDPEGGFGTVSLSYRSDSDTSITITRPDAPEADRGGCASSASNAHALVCVSPGFFTDDQLRSLPKRILAGLTVVPPSDDPSTYFTMAAAFGNRGADDPATRPVRIVQVTDAGDHLGVVWAGPPDRNYAVVTTRPGKQPTVRLTHRRQDARLTVVPGQPYCITVQATDGKHVVETTPYPVRGATCR